MRYHHQPHQAGQRCADVVRDLAIPVPFDLREFRACLERHTHRTIELVPAILAPGAPSGIFFRTTGADYLYYEQQTTPYHQAHIVLFLATHMLRGEVDDASFDRRLVPDVSPELLRLMLGDISDSTVTRADAEEFAFLALDRARLAACPSFLARRALRQLRPLHSALREAAAGDNGAVASGVRPAVRFRLHQQIIEIRDAALALRPYRDPEVASAATVVAKTARLVGDELMAVVEAAVLAAAVRTKNAGNPERRPAADTGWPPTLGADLRSEAGWLMKVSRAFAGLQRADRPARVALSGRKRNGVVRRMGTEGTRLR